MSTSAELAGTAEQREQREVLREIAAQRRRAGLQRLIDRVLLTGAVLLFWELIVRVGWLQPFFISQPSRIIADLSSMFVSGYIFPHLALTLYEALVGLALGTLLGMALGFLAALSPRLADALQPLLVSFNSMPRIAIAPLFIIWFGFGAESKIALTAMVVFFVTFFNTFAGVRSVDPVLVNNIRAMGGSSGHVVQMVLLPVTWAWVFAALKTSISLALVSAVVTEFVGSMAGIGWIMTQASGSLNTTRLFSTMIILAIVGALLFAVVRWVEDHALRWRPNAQL
jgi:NitT/TauT family transport system permease protein